MQPRSLRDLVVFVVVACAALPSALAATTPPENPPPAQTASRVPAVAASTPADDSVATYDRLLARAEVLVTVQFVLQVKMEGAGADREIESEVTCLMLDDRGLILCSNTELGGYVTLLGRLMGGQGFNISANPTDVRVLLSEEEKVPATVLTRDSDRDLVWLRIDEVGERRFAFLDFSAGATLQPGQPFYVLRLMDEFFDRAPIAAEGRIGALVSKPRALLVPSQPVAGGFGLPIFTADGQLVGVTVLQMPGAEEAAQQLGNPLSFIGEAARLQDMTNGLILPAAEVEKATRLVLEMAREEDEE